MYGYIKIHFVGSTLDTEQNVLRHVQSRCGVGESGISGPLKHLLLPRLYE